MTSKFAFKFFNLPQVQSGIRQAPPIDLQSSRRFNLSDKKVFQLRCHFLLWFCPIFGIFPAMPCNVYIHTFFIVSSLGGSFQLRQQQFLCHKQKFVSLFDKYQQLLWRYKCYGLWSDKKRGNETNFRYMMSETIVE